MAHKERCKTMNTIASADELRMLFGLTNEDCTYIEFTALKDITAGFSVKRKYPSNIRFKPPVNQKGEPDALAMIHVLHKDNIEKEATKDQIILRISTFNRYRSKYYDYNFDDPECPTKDSIFISRNTPKPLDLDNYDSYFYDRVTGKLINIDGKQIQGVCILDEIFNAHCNTVHFIKSIPLITKIKTSRLLSKTFKAVWVLLEKLLKIIWNREIVKEDKSSIFFGKVTAGELKLSSIDSITIFGYKLSETIAVLYSVLILSFYTVFFFLDFNNEYIKCIFSNVLLTTCFVIIGLYLLNNLIPNRLILPLINLCRSLEWHFLWKKHKV